MLADTLATALLAPASLPPVLADTLASALLAEVTLAPMQTEFSFGPSCLRGSFSGGLNRGGHRFHIDTRGRRSRGGRCTRIGARGGLTHMGARGRRSRGGRRTHISIRGRASRCVALRLPIIVAVAVDNRTSKAEQLICMVEHDPTPLLLATLARLWILILVCI
jgi:hypothetical protein